MASFLLGYPASTVRDLFLPGTAHVFGNEYNFYGGDNWRITQKLTLNIGLHYEINTPYADAHDYWVNFNPVNAAVKIAGQNGVSKSANWQTDYGSIGPRLGFAYSVSKGPWCAAVMVHSMTRRLTRERRSGKNGNGHSI